MKPRTSLTCWAVIIGFLLLCINAAIAQDPTKRTSFDAGNDRVSDIQYKTVHSAFIDTKSSLTDVQKQQEWQKFKDKWVKWGGLVRDVEDSWLLGRIVYIDMGTAPLTGRDLLLKIEKTSQEAAGALKKGQRITFIGRLVIQPGSLAAMSLNHVTLLP